ncbi:hypothetical protein ACFL29_01290 [Patescibacteria group bacterium]
MLIWILNFSILLLLVLAQNSFFLFLPFINSINFVLLFVIYLSIKNNKAFLPLILFAGYFLDLYSSYTFGIHILALLGIGFLSNYIYYNILTHHRFFPIVLLILLNIIFYHLIIIATVFILGFLKLLSKNAALPSFAFKSIGQEILSTTFFICIIYLIFYLAKRNLKVLFLSSQKSN